MSPGLPENVVSSGLFSVSFVAITSFNNSFFDTSDLEDLAPGGATDGLVILFERELKANLGWARELARNVCWREVGMIEYLVVCD